MQEFVFSGKDLIEGSYGDVLQPFFLDGAVCADFDYGRWIKPADAAPNDRGFAVDVPVDSSVEIAAFSADDDLGKAVVAGVDPLFTGRGAMDVSPSDELLLNLHEKLFRNNRFVVVLNWVKVCRFLAFSESRPFRASIWSSVSFLALALRLFA